MIKQLFIPVMTMLLIALASCGGDKPEQTAQSEPPKPEAIRAESAKAETPQAQDALLQTNIDASRAAVKALGGTLKSELTAAMKQGGPLQALDVCHTKAQELTAMVSAEQGEGVQVSRTSLKYRNSNNAPQDWQSMMLTDFENRKLAGEDPSSLEFSEVAMADGKREFRYMKAIPTGEVCLKCHGTAIDPAVSEKLNTLYPEDKATGFTVGDIRGAFVVTKPL